MKNRRVCSIVPIVQFEPLSMRRPKDLLHIELNAFDSHVLFPRIEADEDLSRFVYLIA
jgi:hypothetical protein